MTTVLQVSDSHLSPRAAFADAHWTAVVEHARRTMPDLVVHTGDISLDGANDVADLVHSRQRMDELPTPWLAVPGNHDIGDIGETTVPIDDERWRRYGDTFTDAQWCVELGGWRLVGIDVQLLGSPLPKAPAAWEWLRVQMSDRRPTALFLHRPLFLQRADETGEAPHRYAPTVVRDRLLAAIDDADVRLVASGHVHQWRRVVVDGRAYVWAPSTWAVLPERWQPAIGEKVTGVVEHHFDGDAVTSTVITPDGMGAPVIGDDFDPPYEA